MSKVVAFAEKLMGMDDRTWLRHANPWSVWTRVVLPLPLIILSIWSRLWLGWGALVPLALTALFVWVNPRLFPVPETFDSWSARGVLGERVLLRNESSIAAHHKAPLKALTVASSLGVIPLAYGLWKYDIGATLLGAMMIVGAKMWFVDRMAWIWNDHLRKGGTIKDLEND
ncbi:hypothetical protein QQG91_10535 [Marivivens sp. LCG002]|uniref:DUF6653 family protein n=1 Tax=Marivivens sp. LCG002 TaxID=3051171 RepID=UPI00255269E6|nr:DUF6653 family protein [Marivivens sp. LCG002]WIV50106.1 hypothetical protein QQG91_10535 [Marivivens sp. LCG002]